jgi:hypothetical protein
MAFYGATSLEVLRFEEESELTSIGHSAFENAVVLTYLVIPNQVNSLGQYFIKNSILFFNY